MRFPAAGPTVLATGLFVALALSASGCAKHPPVEQAATVTPKMPPTAQPVPPDPRVGAVFLGAGSLHTCTGAVLHSATGDLILTAAHCVAQGVDVTFVAGLNDTAAPEDVWHVDAVYLDPRWVQNQDPLADFAIARVGRDTGGTVEAQAGGGLTLGPAPKQGTVVAVTGYGMGVGGGPIGCRDVHVGADEGFSGAGLRRVGRRPVGCAVDRRIDGIGSDRRAERWRLRRRKRLLFTAFRRCDHKVACPCRSRWTGRRRTDGVRR